MRRNIMHFQLKTMSYPISFIPLKALPSLSPPKVFLITCKHNPISNSRPKQDSFANNGSISLEPRNSFKLNSNLAVKAGILATVAEPAMAVTGVNNEPDLVWVLIQIAIVAFWYFLVMPPIIMNWLRSRWYRRNLLETYLQFMFVFMFFPGVLLWAPFLNFRKFPRDPKLKYPWSKPENPSEVKGGFLKYPWATIEDYE